MIATPQLPKPRFRGRLHQIAFFLAVPQGIALVATAAGWLARLAAATYALSLAGLLGVSALYHRLTWTPKALSRMRRLDHSMIFVLIAGTYTPVSLLVLRGPWAIALLGVVWAGAVTGVLLKQLGLERTRKITGTMYIVLGWAAVIAAPWLVARMSAAVLSLIVAGGLLYTLGAIVFARKRPDPNPAVFGYHEDWHVAVVAASLCHYVAILLLVLSR
ncbi:MAG: PAQR family membrane homeostasis protein TrhA [Actinomycetota bacterium]